MGKWNVVDNQTGSTVVFEGDSAPTEKQLDNLFAEQSITASARGTNSVAGPASNLLTAPAPSGPGLMSRIGTGLSNVPAAVATFPPVAAALRGARNLVNPLMAAQSGAASMALKGAPSLMPSLPAGYGGSSALIGGPEGVAAWGKVFSPPMPAPQDAPLAGPVNFPQAPLDKSQRVADKVYLTPAGPRRWTGQAWQRLT